MQEFLPQSISKVPLKHKSSHLGLSIDLQTGSAGIEGRHLGDIVVLPLALLFLELEGDTADGAFLDALHEMGGEAGDFVAEAFGGDDGLRGGLGVKREGRRGETYDFIDYPLVGVEVEGEAGVAVDM